MILIEDKSECCGCTACKHICPTNAITMLEDDEGFYYPKVNIANCINCSLCEQVCPIIKGEKRDVHKPLSVYALKNKDIEARRTSQSGGAFVALADSILKRNGLVYGAGFDKDLLVHHKRIVTKDDYKDVKGSKYVQSDIDKIYDEIEIDLKNGRLVLFSGTPCQVYGIKKYFSHKGLGSNLYLCDLVCHGVPSPALYKDYLKYISRIYKKKIVSFHFRDTSLKWGEQGEKITFNDKSVIRNTYSTLYYQNIMLRPVCGHCPFAQMNRYSDITIGDYWGIENSHKDFKDDNGISLVIVNSKKGDMLYNSIIPFISYVKSDTDSCLQPCLKVPVSVPYKSRENFWNDYRCHGFEYVIKKYGNEDWFSKLKSFIKKVLLLLKSDKRGN